MAYMHAFNRSTQPVFALNEGEVVRLDLPPADERIGLGPLLWGAADEPMTPAYWAAQSWMWALEAPEHFRLGDTLAEELLACILGGHGIPAEVGLAAYQRLRCVLHEAPDRLKDEDAVQGLLAQPLNLGGREVRYRFANQKAAYIAGAFREIDQIDLALSDRRLRDELTKLRGFGPKTASWIVRNWRASDEVAILDVHIVRIGQSIGFLPENWHVARHYTEMEAAYLEFAAGIGVRASVLDSVMWMTVRQLARPRRPSVSQRGWAICKPQLELSFT